MHMNKLEIFMSEYQRGTTPLPVPFDLPEELRKSLRFFHGCELDVTIHENGTVYLAFIGSWERGNGRASAALRWLCDLADCHGVFITGHCDSQKTTLDMLTKTTTPGLSNAQLRAWYERYGFVFRLRGEPTVTFMFREPLSTACCPQKCQEESKEICS